MFSKLPTFIVKPIIFFAKALFETSEGIDAFPTVTQVGEKGEEYFKAVKP